MANGTQPQVDPLDFLNQLLTGVGGAPGPIASLGLPPAAAPVTATPPPVQAPLEAPEFPQLATLQGPAPAKSQRVLGLIADLLKTGARGRGRLGPAQSTLGGLQTRRDEETARLRQEALQKFGVERREFEDRRRRSEGVEDREDAIEREDKQRLEEISAGKIQKQEDILAGLAGFGIDSSQFNLETTAGRAAARGAVMRARLEREDRAKGAKLTAGQLARLEETEAIFVGRIEELENGLDTDPEFFSKVASPELIRQRFYSRVIRRFGNDPARADFLIDQFERAVGDAIDAAIEAKAQPVAPQPTAGQAFSRGVTGAVRPELGVVRNLSSGFGTASDLLRGLFGATPPTTGNVGDEARERRQQEEATRQLAAQGQ